MNDEPKDAVPKMTDEQRVKVAHKDAKLYNPWAMGNAPELFAVWYIHSLQHSKGAPGGVLGKGWTETEAWHDAASCLKPPALAEPAAQAVAAGQGGEPMVVSEDCATCGHSREDHRNGYGACGCAESTAGGPFVECNCDDFEEMPSAPPQPIPPQASAGAETEPMRKALEAIRVRIHFIGWPAESFWEPHPGHRIPDWRYEIALLESALAQPATPEPDWTRIVHLIRAKSNEYRGNAWAEGYKAACKECVAIMEATRHD